MQQGYELDAIRGALQKDQYYPQWTALTNFFSRKWWSRIWTIQEFAIPSNLSFWCGTKSVNRDAVWQSIRAADRCTSVGFKETLAFRYGFNRKRALDRRKAESFDLPLLALAAYFCHTDTTDERDRLYGLRGLATDGDLLAVDYTLSSQEIYLQFAQDFITRHKSLDIICFASIYSAPPSGSLGPSWVPCWQKKNTFLALPLMVSQSCSTHVGNLRDPKYFAYDPSIRYSASMNREAVYEFIGSSLLARGVIVDVVDGFVGSKNAELVQSSGWTSSKTALGFPDSSTVSTPTEILMSICRSLVLDRKDRFLRYAMPTTEFFRDFIGLSALLMTTQEQPSSTPKEWQDWFQWTKPLQIRGRTFESILYDANFKPDLDYSTSPNQDEYWQDTFFGRFFDTTIRMALLLMVTCHGRVGMISEKAKKGDLVCVIFGCSVPVLLRESSEPGDDGFTLVGECFLHECMDGSMLERGDLAERPFLIR